MQQVPLIAIALGSVYGALLLVVSSIQKKKLEELSGRTIFKLLLAASLIVLAMATLAKAF